MKRHMLLLASILLLSACESIQVDRDYDTNRDFASYQSWSWQTPALTYSPDDPRIKSDLTEQRIRDAVTDQLEQRGLRAASANTQGDLSVQVAMIVDDRQNLLTTNYGGGWNNAWGGGYWGGPMYTETQTVDYKVGTLQVDLYDGKDKKLVWRGSDQQIMPRNALSPAERETAIRETVTKVLSQYPPH